MKTPAPAPDLHGHVVVITGATGAIGRATTHLFLAHGAIVAALGRNPTHLQSLKAHGAHTFNLDLLDPHAVGQTADEIQQRLGPASMLLAFAGGNGFPVPTSDETLDHWRHVLETDLTTTFTTIQTYLPQLRHHTASSIVTMSSAAALRPGRSNAAYAAAKAGIIALTRHLARELLPDGVRVNCIAPSAVDNDRLTHLPDAQRDTLATHLPMERIGQPGDVANAAIYLASTQSAYTTGATLELGAPTL